MISSRVTQVIIQIYISSVLFWYLKHSYFVGHLFLPDLIKELVSQIRFKRLKRVRAFLHTPGM